MDRQVSSDVIRNRKLKNRSLIILGLLVLVGGLYFFRSSLSTSIKKTNINVAVAETGNIENTLTATGEVIPEFEQVITSPIQAEIKKVLVSIGATVQPNEAILELNKEFALLKQGKLKDQLSLKQNNMVQLDLQLEKSIYDLEINNQIKDLRIDGLKAALEDEKKLYNIGGSTQESVEKVALNLKIAELEKKQLKNDLDFKQKTVSSDLKDLQLQADIQQKELQEFDRKLQQANITANRSGVLTWVNENIGTKVNEGDILARVADLKSFRIEGAISDVYSERISVGQMVIVRINDHDLRGTIKSIKPTVENNIIHFDIQLEEVNHELLRPNLKVEVFIVTKAKENIIRVANGPAFNGRQQQDIFIIDGNMAKKTTVNIGLSNFDYVEIKDNLKEGEKVIISDMTKYKHLSEILIDDLKR